MSQLSFMAELFESEPAREIRTREPSQCEHLGRSSFGSHVFCELHQCYTNCTTGAEGIGPECLDDFDANMKARNARVREMLRK